MRLTTFEKRALLTAVRPEGWTPSNKQSKARALGMFQMGLLQTRGDGVYRATMAGREAVTPAQRSDS